MPSQYNRAFHERFWSKVDRNGPVPESHPEFGQCWLWTGARWHGYGSAWLPNQRRAKASRVAWGLADGEMPSTGVSILHTCDNPLCVRNDQSGVYVVRWSELPRWGHLAVGTTRHNVIDMFVKGRDNTRRGENAPFVKLTSEDVLNICRLVKTGTGDYVIARLYGVDHKTIWRIRTGQRWGHLTGIGVGS